MNNSVKTQKSASKVDAWAIAFLMVLVCVAVTYWFIRP